MKKKFVCSVLTCCVLGLALAGCGGKSSEEKQAANYYEKELGMDKEDAEELAHELYGEDKEEDSSVAEESPAEIVVEPLPELVNSEWYDCKVQIYDMVFDNNWSMTEEKIRSIVAGSAFNVELSEGFDENGNVVLNNISVNGNLEAQVWRSDINDRNPGTDGILYKYGLLDEGYYYWMTYGFNGSTLYYDKASVEFSDFATRDDVLAYLSANGYTEVDKELAPYKYAQDNKRKEVGSEPTYAQVSLEVTGTPHYWSNGVQSITFHRILKLSETDQELKPGMYGPSYAGACLNMVNTVTFEFNTDGTIASSSQKTGRYIVFGERL